MTSSGWLSTTRDSSSLSTHHMSTTTKTRNHTGAPAVGAPRANKVDESLSMPSPTTEIPILPLDWTRVSRPTMNKVSGDSRDECCKDPTCCREPISIDHFQMFDDGMEMKQRRVMEGQAIFCLPELDCAWFQGYFQASSKINREVIKNQRPIGLLAIQNMEIDDCLQCSDGGYRELSLELYLPSERPVEKAVTASRPNLVLSKLLWTGGDMIKLRGKYVVFDTELLLTGSKAVPFMNECFRGLIDRVRTYATKDFHSKNDEEVQILDLLPNLAIVVGKMKLSLPMDY